MKKSILNLGNTLNKTEQKTINGGMVNCSSSPICYGVFNSPFVSNCGTCEQYNALPKECQSRVLVSVTCFGR